MQHVHWSGLVVLFLLFPKAHAQTPESPKPTVDKAIQFLGKGLAHKDAITFDTKFRLANSDVKVFASWSIQKWNQGRVQLQLEVDQKKPKMTVVWNGDKVWALGPDGKIEDAPKFGGATVRGLFRAIRFAQRPDYLRLSRARLRIVGREKIEKTDAVEIAVAEEGFETIHLYLDATTGEPLKATFPIKTDANQPPEELGLVFEQYKKISEKAGKKGSYTLKGFTKVIVYVEGRKLFEVPLTNVQRHNKLDPALFTRP